MTTHTNVGKYSENSLDYDTDPKLNIHNQISRKSWTSCTVAYSDNSLDKDTEILSPTQHTGRAQHLHLFPMGRALTTFSVLQNIGTT